MNSYLGEREERAMPPGLLGPLLFNIFLYNLLLSDESNYLTDYSDDATPYVSDNNLKEVVSELKSKLIVARKLISANAICF